MVDAEVVALVLHTEGAALSRARGIRVIQHGNARQLLLQLAQRSRVLAIKAIRIPARTEQRFLHGYMVVVVVDWLPDHGKREREGEGRERHTHTHSLTNAHTHSRTHKCSHLWKRLLDLPLVIVSWLVLIIVRHRLLSELLLAWSKVCWLAGRDGGSNKCNKQ